MQPLGCMRASKDAGRRITASVRAAQPISLRVSIGRAAEIAIESEEQRAKGVRRFHDAVRGAQLERRDDQPFVQLDDHDDRDLLRTARNIFEDRERVHIRMVVLGDEDVERKRRPRAQQL